jgi:hypothetical protein
VIFQIKNLEIDIKKDLISTILLSTVPFSCEVYGAVKSVFRLNNFIFKHFQQTIFRYQIDCFDIAGIKCGKPFDYFLRDF